MVPIQGEHVVGGLVAFSLLKKGTAYGLARYYGFPKLYRKIIRMNRRVVDNPAHRNQLSNSVKSVMRFPNRIAASVSWIRRLVPFGQPSTKSP